MTATKNKQVLKNKRKREGAGRKVKTVIKKAHKLGKHPGIDIAVFICNRGRYSTYQSTDRESWPPTMAEIKMAYPVPKILLPCDFEKERRRGIGREDV